VANQKKLQDKRNSWDVDFVNVVLSKDQKTELLKWDVKGEVTFDVISKLVDDGYKLSISADKAHDCVGAYLTSPGNGGVDRKQCLSARGPDMFGAFRSLIFKHAIILEGDWGSVENDGEAGSRWG
jgi:hypothetical protein